MIKKELLLIVLFIKSIMLSAQFKSIDNYEWDKERSLFKIDALYQNSPAVMIKYSIVHEITYSNANNTEVEVKELIHRVVKINEVAEIGNYNKVYIPISDERSLIDIKARTISPSGSITEFDKSNIKEIKEEKSQYLIFAIEGAEVGGEIEYIYTIKKAFSYVGSYNFEFGLPILKADFTLKTPENLIFETKSYNGLPSTKDTIINEHRYVFFEAFDLPFYEEEKFGFKALSSMRLETKLAYNTAKGRTRMYTWQEAAQIIFNSMNTLSPKETKLISKTLKDVKINKTDTEDDKIRKIDTYIKKNFYINRNLNTTNIEHTLKTKLTTSNGMVRLYAAFFLVANIENELVYTSNRTETKFDPDFDSWIYLEKPLFFFPNTSKYLAPDNMFYRYGIIPFSLMHNYGLFIKKINLGGANIGMEEIRFIDAPPASKSQHNLFINIEFIDDLSKNKITLRSEKSGYSALLHYMYYPFYSDEDKEKNIQDIVDYFFKEAKFESIDILEEIEHPLSYDPINLKIVANTSEFIEQAGNKIILRIGETIGPQSELYAKTTRKLPVENYYNRSYSRDITLNIPKGYMISNLEDLNFDISFKKEEKETMSFKSSYIIENNVLKIHIFEVYEEISLPVERFSEFQKVVNAAADFNKVFLIIEPAP